MGDVSETPARMSSGAGSAPESGSTGTAATPEIPRTAAEPAARPPVPGPAGSADVPATGAAAPTAGATAVRRNRGAGDASPASGTSRRLAQGREHIVATVNEIPPGSSKVVPIGRHGVGVYNVNGTFYAIANYCPHEGGPLCAGRTRGRTVVDESVPGDSVMVRDNEFIYCPWHQWGFELATGTTAVKPEWSIRTYPVRVVGEDVLVTA